MDEDARVYRAKIECPEQRGIYFSRYRLAYWRFTWTVQDAASKLLVQQYELKAGTAFSSYCQELRCRILNDYMQFSLPTEIPPVAGLLLTWLAVFAVNALPHRNRGRAPAGVLFVQALNPAYLAGNVFFNASC